MESLVAAARGVGFVAGVLPPIKIVHASFVQEWVENNAYFQKQLSQEYQPAEGGTSISKTQHYLPAACSSSQTPMPTKLILFKRGTDIPVNVYSGPIVVTN